MLSPPAHLGWVLSWTQNMPEATPASRANEWVIHYHLWWWELATKLDPYPQKNRPQTQQWKRVAKKKKSAIVLKETLHWPIIAKIPVSESSYKKERDHVLHFWHLGGRSISESDGWQGDKVHGCEAKEKDIWPKTISLSPCRQAHAHQKPCYPTPWHGFRYISFACLLQIILEKYLWPFRVSGTS